MRSKARSIFIVTCSRGARFRVIYESLYSSGEYLRAGRLLAVELESQRQAILCILVRQWQQTWRLLCCRRARPEAGISAVAACLHAGQLRFQFATARIRFSAMTLRIVASTIPLAAGTDVRSIAEGVVTFAGWQRGYGNVVEIRHDGKHVTLYAHLQSVAPGLRQGRTDRPK